MIEGNLDNIIDNPAEVILQLQKADPNYIKQHLSFVGKRIVYELRGISALDLEQVHSKKSITVSRSF